MAKKEKIEFSSVIAKDGISVAIITYANTIGDGELVVATNDTQKLGALQGKLRSIGIDVGEFKKGRQVNPLVYQTYLTGDEVEALRVGNNDSILWIKNIARSNMNKTVASWHGDISGFAKTQQPTSQKSVNIDEELVVELSGLSSKAYGIIKTNESADISYLQISSFGEGSLEILDRLSRAVKEYCGPAIGNGEEIILLAEKDIARLSVYGPQGKKIVTKYLDALGLTPEELRGSSLKDIHNQQKKRESMVHPT